MTVLGDTPLGTAKGAAMATTTSAWALFSWQGKTYSALGGVRKLLGTNALKALEGEHVVEDVDGALFNLFAPVASPVTAAGGNA